MKEKNPSSFAGQIWGTLLFTIAGIAIIFGYIHFIEPLEEISESVATASYSENQLLEGITEVKLNAEMERIKVASMDSSPRLKGRVSGSPGFYATEKLILDTFQQAGLKVETQEFQVMVPVTEYCEILDEKGAPLPGVVLYPFDASGLIPTSLPPEGITAKLTITKSSNSLDLIGKPLDNRIVVNRGVRCTWPSIAALGAKAVIVTEENFENRKGDVPLSWTSMMTSFDVDYPRFFASGSLDAYEDRTVTVRCKVKWQSQKIRNIIGVLGPQTPNREALVVNSYYDSYSVVPELSPGAEQSISLAVMLEYVRAFAPYKDQLKRDLVFVASAGHGQTLEGACKLMEAIERFSQNFVDCSSLKDRLAEAELKFKYAQKASEIVGSEEPWSEKKSYREKWFKEDLSFRKWFDQAFNTVTGEVALDFQEQGLIARLAWIRAGKPFRNTDPIMHEYLEKREMDKIASEMVSIPFWSVAAKLKEMSSGQVQVKVYQEKSKQYFKTLEDYHAQQIKELKDSLRVRELFEPYGHTLTLNLELYSGGAKEQNDLAVLMGIRKPGPAVMPQSMELRDLISEQIPMEGSEPAFNVTSWGIQDAEGGGKEDPNIHSQKYAEMESEIWFRCARQAFTIVNKKFYPMKVGTPEDRFENLGLSIPHEHSLVIGKSILSILFGKIPFKDVPLASGREGIFTFFGNVYTSIGTSSLIPTHRMGVNTLVHPFPANNSGPVPSLPELSRGIRVFPIFQTDPYGRYERIINLGFHLVNSGGTTGFTTPNIDGARFSDDGRMLYYKDASRKSQTIFKNESVPSDRFQFGRAKQIHLSLFRCSETALFQFGNPNSMASFKRFHFRSIVGFQEPEKIHYEDSIKEIKESKLPGSPAILAFLPPDYIFELAFQDAIPGNDEILAYRAFMLNVDSKKNIAPGEPDLEGRGYLAADTPNLSFPYFDMAASMHRTAKKRLGLLEKYRMTDEQMLESQKRAEQSLEEAYRGREEGKDIEAANFAARSLSDLMNDHPVIRTKVSQAILGVLWYLALLVPFAFFFEKLVFGFTDIRKQLLAHGIIFVSVFGLLYYFHPAFQMVRSSMMILFGFLIFLLSLIVALMVAGKFKQTVKILRRKEGSVEGADVNRGGVVGTAFMLGLNNMRRRKVRTALTSGTLILITFVMICFTSISSNWTNTQHSTGRSPVNGLFWMKKNFEQIKDVELQNLEQTYGLRFPISIHYWMTAILKGEKIRNPDIAITRKITVGEEKSTKEAHADGAVVMPPDEWKFSSIENCLLTKKGWFRHATPGRGGKGKKKAGSKVGASYVLLPVNMAERLGITVEDVNEQALSVDIRGEPYEVWGIFDPIKMTEFAGMDGQSVLPYDATAPNALQRSASGGKESYRAVQDVQRLKGSQVIIASSMPPIPKSSEEGEQEIAVSCTILFPKEPYQLRPDLPQFPAVTHKEQQELVNEYLEHIGYTGYYAIDGYSYSGSRTREKSIAGIMDLVIPLLIAAMTVFNTMRGSVYERKSEIYVYNAVGIAPNHIFFMFMAEACVYAVIGAMMGYLLSQVTGTILMKFGLTGGLNMDYSSIETIYASLAIVASVLISTIAPARTASKLALPSDEVSWTIPEPQGDVMEFNLPFTFGGYDRVAVLSYFYRWLDAHGEGSSGSFSSSNPDLHFEEEDASVIPWIEATIWLKPFDLGVSQRVKISLPYDPETEEYVAHIHIERISGSISAWSRAILPFLFSLRKQFLNWRAVTESERAEMFEEAKGLVNQFVEEKTAHV